MVLYIDCFESGIRDEKCGGYKMFSNIGSKIKALAAVISFLGIAASVIYGGVVAYKEQTLYGVLIIIVGSLVSWLSCLTLYGLGQLIDNSDKIVEKLEEMSKNKDEN